MIFLRTELGAVKCAFRDLLREALTVVENFIAPLRSAGHGWGPGVVKTKPLE